jgi:hypothetical protein
LLYPIQDFAVAFAFAFACIAIAFAFHTTHFATEFDALV